MRTESRVLWAALVDAPVPGVEQGAVDAHGAPGPQSTLFHFRPRSSPRRQAGDQQQVPAAPPLQGLAGQGLEDLAHLLGLVIVGGAGLLFGRGGPAGRVEGG